MIIKKLVTTRIPVRLLDSAGSAVTGALANIFAGSTVYIVKADGTVASLVLVLGTNFFEISSTNAPGLYHISVDGSNFGVEGPTQLCGRPSASAFVAFVASFQVENFPNVINTNLDIASSAINTLVQSIRTDYTTVRAGKLDLLSNLDTTVSSRADNSLNTLIQQLSDIELGKWQIYTTGADANRLVLYKPDGTTVIKKFDLKDGTGAPTYLNPYSRTPV